MADKTQVNLETRALTKAIAHTLKHSNKDCIGVLLGQIDKGMIVVEDAVPLFHDRVFASALESAFSMVQCVYSDKQIVGVYDAPLKYKSGDAIQMSSLSDTLATQIRSMLNLQEVACLSLKVPSKVGEEDSDEDQIREVTEDQAAEHEGTLIIDAYVIGPGRTHKAIIADSHNQK